ncbi:aldehyde-activating protein [Altererythrobacter sp. B11]|nr:aldehyde-activating protein [Altererythrobacter sp. B11]
MLTGGCRCGEVRYEVEGPVLHHALCHCGDCRASSGAPVMAWMAFAQDGFRVTKGTAKAFHGSGGSVRHFCGTCGSGLYFLNAEMLPGVVDIQSATLDDAAEHAPTAQIQTAERLPWMTRLGEMAEFERFPGG